jgi:hypothetical protein
MILGYRIPSKPTAGQVAVWRLLKKVSAIYLRQSGCAFPDNSAVRHNLSPILNRSAVIGSVHQATMRPGRIGRWHPGNAARAIPFLAQGACKQHADVQLAVQLQVLQGFKEKP